MPKETPINIIQLLCCPWDQDDHKRTYSLVGLADNGGAYRLDKAAGAWIPLPRRIRTAEEAVGLKKKKYASNYTDCGRPVGSPYEGQD